MDSGGMVASICAAPALVLGTYRMLEGRRYTCYPGFEENQSSGFFSDNRVVVDGNLITSRSAGTAAEFSLAIIRYLLDDEMAKKIAASVLLTH